MTTPRAAAWPLTAALALGACARASAPVPPTLPAPRGSVDTTTGEIEIVDPGQIYTSINETQCLTWPSDDLRARGGGEAWARAGVDPMSGTRGRLVGEAVHCDSGERILLLEVGAVVVPVAAQGTRTVDGEVPAAATTGPAQAVVILDPGRAYPNLAEAECARWNPRDLVERAHAAAWRPAGYWPAVGDVGRIVGNATTCDRQTLLVIDVDGHLVPIPAAAVEPR